MAVDVSRVRDEKGVKKIVKKLLDQHGWFWWCPPGNGYGTHGVHDFNCFRHGIFLTVETKFGSNKLTHAQKAFGQTVMSHQGFAFAVNEKNIDWFEAWLAAFDRAMAAQQNGEDIAVEDGALMLNAINALTDLLAE